jgi:hypothetical protein
MQTTTSVGTDSINNICYFIASRGKYIPKLWFLNKNSWIVLNANHLAEWYILFIIPCRAKTL